MMRALLRPNNRKSALSNIIAYVLLISITISLSVMVYSWLRFYVSQEDVAECSDGVNVIIRSYECYEGSRLQIVLKNKGLFKIDGYVLRVHDRADAEFGFYTFDEKGASIMPGEEYTATYYFEDNVINGYMLDTVTLVEVQPFILDGGQISCKSYAFQKVECST
ncbi:MAG: hypothetical protein OEL87_02990 [Nanoarchaeota archaeon]|nr:hypothetical protein [Nanoarchaeota archaeon]